jgi:excisionase family DNA binding protein
MTVSTAASDQALPASVGLLTARTGGRGRTEGTYLTIQEVAELARCEHRSVRRAINSGHLRAFRPTRKR